MIPVISGVELRGRVISKKVYKEMVKEMDIIASHEEPSQQ